MQDAHVPANRLASSPGHRWRDFGPAALLLAIGILGLVIATLSPSGRNGQYAVIAPPWYNSGQTVSLIQHADGQLASMNAASRVVIAHSEKPGFVRDLYRAGAWLVLDPLQLRGCGDVQTAVGKERS